MTKHTLTILLLILSMAALGLAQSFCLPSGRPFGSSIQQHRISREGAERVRQAEKVGGQQAGLKIPFQETATAQFV
jgi:hypothetical protein